MKKTMFLRILSIAWLTLATAFLAAGQLHAQPRILGVCDGLPDQAALASAGVKVESWLPSTGVCVMELIDSSFRVESVLVDLSLLDVFETIELDSTLQAQRMPSDPLFPQQWALRDASENGAGLGIASAWDTTVGSQAVVVGVVDTGMDASHPDLLHNLFINPFEIGGNGVDDDANGYVDDILGVDVISGSSIVADASGHGTHVAGIIGAAGDNVIGISGVNWQVSLLAVKAFDANGQGLVSDVLKGYEYLLGMKAAGVNLRVVNNSFASPVWSAALERGVRRMAQADVFMVFAAGDSGLDLDKGGAYPAAYAGVYGVTVGSMDASGALSAKSNYGPNTVEMMAPGEGIVSTLPNGQYGEMSGSSMAAAHVSGVAALLMATDETLPASALKGVMKGEGTSSEGPVALNAKGSLESLAAWQALDIKPMEALPSFSGESTLEFADAPVKVMDLPSNGQGLPAGAVFDPDTRTFTWTPTEDQVGDHQITFWVSDGIDEDSETITITVTSALPVATPTFSPEPGTYAGSVDVTMSCATPGATIRYTTNGADPTESSTIYGGGTLTYTRSRTIKAMAFKAGQTASETATGVFIVSGGGIAATPTFSPEPGAFANSVSVTMSCATPGATIRYTTNGVDPTDSSTIYGGGTLTYTSSRTIKAKAFKAGLTASETATGVFVVTAGGTVATPTFSPAPGTYSGSVSVSMACSTAGATIRYTTNGADPTESSTIYGGGTLTYTSSRTIKAKAFRDGFTSSAIATGMYIVSSATPVATPTFSPAPGTYSGSVSVSMACSTAGATIRYTTNGADPTESSTIYGGGTLTYTSSRTIKAKAFRDGFTSSAIATGMYIVSSATPVATPTFSPAPGTYSGSVSVSMACSTAGATIRYTTNGADPTESSTIYGGGTLTYTSSRTIKAKAFKAGQTASATATGVYIISSATPVATPTFSPEPGTFSGSVGVTMACSTAGATIRYTTDGSDPTESSTIYGGGTLTYTSSRTIKAKAFKAGQTASATATGVYIVSAGGTVATPTFSPAPGTYSGSVSVTMNCATSGATMRYTTNGAEPTDSSTIYRGGTLNYTSSLTIKVKAFKAGMTASAAATGVYYVNP